WQRIVLIFLVLAISVVFLPDTYDGLADAIMKVSFVVIIFSAVLGLVVKPVREIGYVRCGESELEIFTEDIERTFNVAKISKMHVLVSTYVGASVGLRLAGSNGCGNKLDIVIDGSNHNFTFKISNRGLYLKAYDFMKRWESINPNIKVVKPII